MATSPAQPPSSPGPARPGPASASERKAADGSQAADGFALLLAALLPTPLAAAAGAPAPSSDAHAEADASGAGASAPIAGVAPAPAQGAEASAPTGAPGGTAAGEPGRPIAAINDSSVQNGLSVGTAPASEAASSVDRPGNASRPQAILPAAAPQAVASADAAPADAAPADATPPEVASAEIVPAEVAATGSPSVPAAAAAGADAPTATRPTTDRTIAPAGAGATRLPDRSGSGVLTAPPNADPATDDPQQPLPPQTAPGTPDSSPSPGARPAAQPSLHAPVAPGPHPAAAPRSETSAPTDLLVEPAVDLAAATPIRSEHAPSAPAAAPHQASASTPLTQPAVQLGLQIAAAVPRRVERLFVRLEPPALGRVEVRLEFSRDNRVSAVIAADRHDTLNVLQRDSGALQRALQDAGLRLGDNGLSFSLRQEQRQPGGGAGVPYPLRVDPAAGPAELAQPLNDPRPVYWFGAQRILDIRI